YRKYSHSWLSGPCRPDACTDERSCRNPKPALSDPAMLRRGTRPGARSTPDTGALEERGLAPSRDVCPCVWPPTPRASRWAGRLGSLRSIFQPSAVLLLE